MKIISLKSKRAAMEMSVGTMVTIVLLMIVLVLGIFFIQKIFSSGTNAIDQVDNQIQSQIQKLFADDDQAKTVFYPTSKDVIVKKGDTPKGFAFQVRNNDVERAAFSYVVSATDVSKCGSTLSIEKADDMLLGGAGSFDLAPGDFSDSRIVKFVVPDSAPSCTLEYDLKVTKEENTPYSDINFFLTIK